MTTNISVSKMTSAIFADIPSIVTIPVIRLDIVTNFSIIDRAINDMTCSDLCVLDVSAVNLGCADFSRGDTSITNLGCSDRPITNHRIIEINFVIFDSKRAYFRSVLWSYRDFISRKDDSRRFCRIIGCAHMNTSHATICINCQIIFAVNGSLQSIDLNVRFLIHTSNLAIHFYPNLVDLTCACCLTGSNCLFQGSSRCANFIGDIAFQFSFNLINLSGASLLAGSNQTLESIG
ncbi:hypothetical protein BvCmsOUNP013_01974 [Escherichia coli]|nr:hypothetical protein BvCmsOUNP013_01974 [Escherichia coli]